jgi:competence protein ComEC
VRSEASADTRLAFPAIAAWAAAAVLIGVPAGAFGTALGALALTMLLSLVAIWRSGTHRRVSRHGSRRGAANRVRSYRGREGVLAVTFLAVSLVASVVTVREGSRSPPLLSSAIEDGRTVAVAITVTDKTEPQLRTPSRPWNRDTGQSRPAEQRIRGTVTELTVGRRTTTAAVPVVVFAETGRNGLAAIGEKLVLTGRAATTDPGEQAAALIFAQTVETVAPPPPWLAWAPGMRAGLVDGASRLPGRGGELLPGLAAGDTSAVSAELDEAMTASSLSHLTAVSGANCAIIVAVLVLVLSALGVPRWLRIAGALIGLGFFVILVTPEPSVLRAALMAVAVLLALGMGRPVAGLPVLSLVVMVLVIGDPWLSRSYGFVLSVLATAGLLTLTRPLARLLAAWMPRPLAAAVAIPLAAQLACQPVLILLDPSLALYGVPANLLAAPAAPAATILGLLGCLATPVFAPLAALVLWLGWLPASWIAGVATTTAALPAARLPWLDGWIGALALGVVTVAVLALGVARERGRPLVVLTLSALVVVAAGGYLGALFGERVGPRLALPQHWSYAACDIGQGDAVLVRSGDAIALVDTGPDPDLLGDCLDTLGISRVDLLVLTHFDLDHVGGVPAVVGRATRVLTGPPGNAADERMLDGLDAGGAQVIQAAAGTHGQLGTLGWHVHWPPVHTRNPPAGNDASVVMDFDGDGLRSLFLGDLSERAQQAVLATRTLRGTFDIVKVAHHGSADQSESLYQEISARVGLISVGADNDYGHPARSILDILGSVGTTALRTDNCGLIVIAPSSVGVTLWTERSDAGCP